MSNFNIRDVLNEALAATRADMAPGETKQFYNRVKKLIPVHLIPEKKGFTNLMEGKFSIRCALGKWYGFCVELPFAQGSDFCRIRIWKPSRG